MSGSFKLPTSLTQKRIPGTRWIGELVDHSDGLNVVKTVNISLSVGKPNILSVACRKLLIKTITYKHFRSSNNTCVIQNNDWRMNRAVDTAQGRPLIFAALLIIKIDLGEMGYEYVMWIELDQDRVQRCASLLAVLKVMILRKQARPCKTTRQSFSQWRVYSGMQYSHLLRVDIRCFAH